MKSASLYTGTQSKRRSLTFTQIRKQRVNQSHAVTFDLFNKDEVTKDIFLHHYNKPHPLLWLQMGGAGTRAVHIRLMTHTVCTTHTTKQQPQNVILVWARSLWGISLGIFFLFGFNKKRKKWLIVPVKAWFGPKLAEFMQARGGIFTWFSHCHLVQYTARVQQHCRTKAGIVPQRPDAQRHNDWAGCTERSFSTHHIANRG